MRISSLFLKPVLIALMVCTPAFGMARAVEPKGAVKSPQLEQSYIWHNGDREETVWLNPGLLAEFNSGESSRSAVKTSYPEAKETVRRGAIQIWTLGGGLSSETATRKLMVTAPGGSFSPVFHDSGTPAGRMRALPGGVIVYLNPEWEPGAVEDWAERMGLEIVQRLQIGENIIVISTGPGIEALWLESPELNSASSPGLSHTVSSRSPLCQLYDCFSWGDFTALFGSTALLAAMPKAGEQAISAISAGLRTDFEILIASSMFVIRTGPAPAIP